MGIIDFTSFLGGMLLLALALIGAWKLGEWILLGYRLECKRLNLGESCQDEADDVLREIKSPIFPPIRGERIP